MEGQNALVGVVSLEREQGRRDAADDHWECRRD